jgi:hypothetical protein
VNRDAIAADAVARTLRAYENPRVRAAVAAGTLSTMDAADLLEFAIVVLDQAGAPVEIQAELHDLIDQLGSVAS